jgi:hypothetical protein
MSVTRWDVTPCNASLGPCATDRSIPPWTARTARRDIARGRIYSRLGRGLGGGNRPPRRQAHPGAPSLPRGAPKGRHNRHFQPAAGKSEMGRNFPRLMHGILNMGLAVRSRAVRACPSGRPMTDHQVVAETTPEVASTPCAQQEPWRSQSALSLPVCGAHPTPAATLPPYSR